MADLWNKWPIYGMDGPFMDDTYLIASHLFKTWSKFGAGIDQLPAECPWNGLQRFVVSSRLPSHTHRGLVANNTIAPTCVLVPHFFVKSSHDPKRIQPQHEYAYLGDRPLDSLLQRCFSIIPLSTCSVKNNINP